MHRSGTSMFSRLLMDLGVHMGADQSENAESLFFQNINREIMTRHGGRWDLVQPVIERMRRSDIVDQEAHTLEQRLFAHGGVNQTFSSWQRLTWQMGGQPAFWGWKDPRNSVTLPIWLRLFPGARVIHVLRNGIDVSISLHRREVKVGSRNPDVAENLNCFADYLRLWEDYVGGCLEHVSSFPNGDYRQVRYENLLVDPGRELGEILEFLKITPSTSKFERVKKSIKTSRLDNQKFRDEFSAQIATLPESSMMRELGYR